MVEIINDVEVEVVYDLEERIQLFCDRYNISRKEVCSAKISPVISNENRKIVPDKQKIEDLEYWYEKFLDWETDFDF